MTCRLLAALGLFVSGAWAATPDSTNHFVYQIFVRSFADTPADSHPSGEIGDLRGIRENLDYLNDGRPGTGSDLEVGILWLMPVFPSGSYHGYDIDDYRAVNPEYGTMKDLRDLVEEAHRRGVRIILDIAFNHTSNRHTWFQQAIKDPSSPFRRFYKMRPSTGAPRPSGWHTTEGVDYHGLFSPKMPDLNFDEPAVRREIKAVAKFWLDQGIDGFRLDAAKHIFDADAMGGITDAEIGKNNTWWREFSDYVYSVNPKAVLVGEVLGPPDILRRHARGLDALLDEPFMDMARGYIAAPGHGFLKRWREASKGYRPWVFIGSHDRTPRLASFLQQRAPKRTEQAYRLGMFLLFTTTRHFVLYNGDELMQKGIKWPGSQDGSKIYDETLREPLPWYRSELKHPQTSWFKPRYDKPNDGISVEEQSEPGKMLHLVRRLSQLRAQHPDFANGKIDAVLTDTDHWLVFAKGRYLAFIRSLDKPGNYRLPSQWRNLRVVFRSGGGSQSRVTDNVDVPASGFVLLQRP